MRVAEGGAMPEGIFSIRRLTNKDGRTPVGKRFRELTGMLSPDALAVSDGDLVRFLLRGKGKNFFVLGAFAGDMLVGTVKAQFLDQLPGKELRVDYVVVDPAFEGRGISVALWHHAIIEAEYWYPESAACALDLLRKATLDCSDKNEPLYAAKWGFSRREIAMVQKGLYDLFRAIMAAEDPAGDA